MWTNLIDNAVDAMNGKGELVIRLRKEGQCIAMEVEDTGPGIPDSTKPKIFDAFFTTQSPGKGTGLGLNVTFNIVEHRHRGSIDVEKVPLKTTCRAWLPVSLTGGRAAGS